MEPAHPSGRVGPGRGSEEKAGGERGAAEDLSEAGFCECTGTTVVPESTHHSSTPLRNIIGHSAAE